MKKKFQSLKGFTLVEMVVVLAIVSILTISVTTLLIASMRSVKKSDAILNRQTIANLIIQKIRSETQYAQDLTIYGSKESLAANLDSDSNKNYLYFGTPVTGSGTKGLVKKDGLNAQTYLNGNFAAYDCRVTFNAPSAYILSVKVTIWEKSGVPFRASKAYSVSTDISVSNIEAGSGKQIILTDGARQALNSYAASDPETTLPPNGAITYTVYQHD